MMSSVLPPVVRVSESVILLKNIADLPKRDPEGAFLFISSQAVVLSSSLMSCTLKHHPNANAWK